MTSPRPAHERFAELLAPKIRKDRNGDPIPRRVVEDDEYVAMMYRMIRGLELRACNDPAILPHCVALAQRLSEVTNVAIEVQASKYALDPHSAASMAECAAALGIKVPSASERRKRGKAIIAARLAAAGAINFSEAKREREIMTNVENHNVVVFAEYRARHRAA